MPLAGTPIKVRQRGRAAVLRWILGVIGTLGGTGATVTGLLGWAGWWLIAIGVTAALAGAVVLAWNKFREEVGPELTADRHQQASLRAILRVEPQAASAIDPEAVGVFRSVEAQRLAGTAPPYVTRSADAVLRRRLRERGHDGLVVVVGDPKSGKSRTAWEGVRACAPQATVLAIRTPYRGEDDAAAAREPLTALTAIDFRGGGDDVVVWIDDAHEHLNRGLRMTVLQELRTRLPSALVVLTIHAEALSRVEALDAPLAAHLRRASEGFHLDNELTDAELTGLPEAYRTIPDGWEQRRLPEYLAGVTLLRQRYRESAHTLPVGVALVDAAVAWRRCGMPPGCPRDHLEALTQITLRRLRLVVRPPSRSWLMH